MLNITEKAIKEFKKLLSTDDNTSSGIRIYTNEGG